MARKPANALTKHQRGSQRLAGASKGALSFTVYGAAAPAGSKTTGVSKAGRRFVRDSNPRAAPWKTEVAKRAAEAMKGRKLFEEAIAVQFSFFIPRPKGHFGKNGILPSARKYPTVKPDCLKLARAVEDAMTGVVYRDDAQIVSELLRKEYGDPSRVVILVQQMKES